jgi:hypothetical protein
MAMGKGGRKITANGKEKPKRGQKVKGRENKNENW